jgi:hypothetical protein
VLVAATGARLSAPTVSVGVPATHVDEAAAGERVTPPVESTGSGAVHVDTAAEGVNVTGVAADATAAGGRTVRSAIATRPMMRLNGRAGLLSVGAAVDALAMTAALYATRHAHQPFRLAVASETDRLSVEPPVTIFRTLAPVWWSDPFVDDPISVNALPATGARFVPP